MPPDGDTPSHSSSPKDAVDRLQDAYFKLTDDLVGELRGDIRELGTKIDHAVSEMQSAKQDYEAAKTALNTPLYNFLNKNIRWIFWLAVVFLMIFGLYLLSQKGVPFLLEYNKDGGKVQMNGSAPLPKCQMPVQSGVQSQLPVRPETPSQGVPKPLPEN